MRRAIASYPQDPRVVVVATCGLSHQVLGERAGFNNTPWDLQFLDLFEKDPERLATLAHAGLAELGGVEGAEVMKWLTMRGAVSAQVRKVHQASCLPSMTGIAVAVYEKQAGLGDEEGDLVRRRGWRGLIHFGAIFFMLEKLGALAGVSNLRIHATMRGEALEAFQKTRNAPGAL